MFQSQQQRQRPRSLWDKIWKDRTGHVVVFQWPRAPLIAWMVLTIISLLAASRTTANVFWWLSMVALAVWAVLEIFRGVNYFRRGLGVVILLIGIASAFGVGL